MPHLQIYHKIAVHPATFDLYYIVKRIEQYSHDQHEIFGWKTKGRRWVECQPSNRPSAITRWRWRCRRKVREFTLPLALACPFETRLWCYNTEMNWPYV